MTGTVKSWIEERRTIHDAATEGPWKARPGDEIEGPGGDNLMGGDMEYFYGFMLRGENAAAIVDAHNNLPRALNALKRVLELHKPIFYYEHEDSCTNTDEDHRAERHVEFDLGEYYCEDLPTGEKTCDSCWDDEGERVAYPCPTVQAIEGAINE